MAAFLSSGLPRDLTVAQRRRTRLGGRLSRRFPGTSGRISNASGRRGFGGIALGHGGYRAAGGCAKRESSPPFSSQGRRSAMRYGFLGERHLDWSACKNWRNREGYPSVVSTTTYSCASFVAAAAHCAGIMVAQKKNGNSSNRSKRRSLDRSESSVPRVWSRRRGRRSRTAHSPRSDAGAGTPRRRGLRIALHSQVRNRDSAEHCRHTGYSHRKDRAEELRRVKGHASGPIRSSTSTLFRLAAFFVRDNSRVARALLITSFPALPDYDRE